MPGEDGHVDEMFEELVMVKAELERTKKELERSENKTLEWQRETTSASPGGSEYCSPKAMRDYIIMIRKDLHVNKVARIRGEKRIRELEDDLRSAGTLMKQLRDAENKNPDGPVLPIY